MSTDSELFAGVELGGTKTIVSLGAGRRIVASVSMPTGDPAGTLAAANTLLMRWAAEHRVRALGIAAFGPVVLDPGSPHFGQTLATPKPGWDGVDLPAALTHGLSLPWALDTDVNAAAMAEYRWGAASGLDAVWYVTIGTGVGGGLLVDGKPLHGAMHPEIGHMRLRRAAGDGFAGHCPFHGDCIEGLVSGPALTARFAVPVEQVGDDDPRWHHVAADLSELAATLLLATSARAILFGGTVSLRRAFLLPMVRRMAVERLAGYLPFASAGTMASIIRPAGLGPEAGPLGGIALAETAAGR